MRSFTNPSMIKMAFKHLRHNEENPSIYHPREPLVAYCHIPFAVLIGIVYFVFAQNNVGQNWYFGVTVGLYASSTAYHTVRPSKVLRIIDQIMIAGYVLVTPLPFVYQETWAVPVFFTLWAGISVKAFSRFIP